MSHQPFESWILDSVELSLENRRTLQAHMETCKQCQRLERRWQAVSQELRARPMAAPAAGFTSRWQASLAERRLQAQRKQALRIFGYLLGGALLILLILTSYILGTTSPSQWLEAFVQLMNSSLHLADLAYYLMLTWFSTTPFVLNIALWIYLTISLCFLSVVWVLVLWRTKTMGVLNQ